MSIQRKLKEESELLVESVIRGMQEKKAENIVTLDLRQIDNSVSDFFIICTGNSSTQVDAIADSVEEFVRKEIHEKPWHTEGKKNSQWILLDYFSVVVHIFQKEYRDFYRIEDLWADAEVNAVQSQN